jgi:hypothetical protein
LLSAPVPNAHTQSLVAKIRGATQSGTNLYSK